MLKHTFLLFLLYGIRSSIGRPQGDVAEARQEVQSDRFKKGDVGANGSGVSYTESGGGALDNFRNPVLEYLMREAVPRKTNGILREIRHSQTLLLPAGKAGIIEALERKPVEDPGNGSEVADHPKDPGTTHGLVTSQTLQLKKNQTEGEWSKTEVFPASAVVVSTYNKDGTLKSSVTHFHPSVNLGAAWIPAPSLPQGGLGPGTASWSPPTTSVIVPSQRIQWPLAGYFPIVINDPFLAAYSGITSGVYNTLSSIVEYGPEADICRKKEQVEKIKTVRKEIESGFDEVRLNADLKLVESSARKRNEADEFSDIFDEVVVETHGSKSKSKAEGSRRRSARDTTGIQLNFKNGDRINLQLEEPQRKSNVFLPAEPEERTRAHTVMLVNPPPLSSIARPSNSGYTIKKKMKPQKPDKEGTEGSGEDVGEEQEETPAQGGSSSDGVAVSPPPDGASVAEAKPVGLAIAGPGGVAAAKPQGTAVAGPGGLAIARPIGTAIAGVEVEGTVPIGGPHKNKKKKPKQDPEKMDDQSDTELHYVGGLTGPIGNPQPNTKDFGPGITAKSRNHDNLLFQGKFNADGYQLKLGEQDGKYGFYPIMASPERGSSDRIQKRMDSPTMFHGLIGSRNIQPRGSQGQMLPNFYI